MEVDAPAGRVIVLRQDGCEIVYAYADDVGAPPVRLCASTCNDLELRIVIDRWRDVVTRWRRSRRAADNGRMRTLTVPAPAKLNLFLHVTGRRTDGYHTLESLMVALDVGDTITLTRARRRRDPAHLGALPGVAPQDDLAVRAAQALKRDTGCASGVDIAVVKRIPLGGGLGGGSSDAATRAPRAQPTLGSRRCRARRSCASASRWAPTFRSSSAASRRWRAASASA